MLPWLIVAMQAADPARAADPAADPTRVVRRCPMGTGGDVVVCGRHDQEHYRLRPLPERFVAREVLPRAEMQIGSARAGLRAEDADVGGFTSHRVMVGIKLPF